MAINYENCRQGRWNKKNQHTARKELISPCGSQEDESLYRRTCTCYVDIPARIIAEQMTAELRRTILNVSLGSSLLTSTQK